MPIITSFDRCYLSNEVMLQARSHLSGRPISEAMYSYISEVRALKLFLEVLVNFCEACHREHSEKVWLKRIITVGAAVF